jgi:hypothetical protein
MNKIRYFISNKWSILTKCASKELKINEKQFKKLIKNRNKMKNE